MEKKLLPYLVVISALSVSLSAAFYSVTGLGKMFSGASIQVMIMMSSLEIAKLVLASLLYQYWTRLNRALKTYYFIALFVLMSITSAGIYGYLSSAYSETLNKVENIDKQVKVLETKREMFQTQLNDAREEKDRINQNIAELTKGVSNNFVQSKDRNGNIITTSSSANRKVYEEQLKSSQKRRDDILLTETALSDSITKIDLKKLDLETNTDIAGEVGPLKYIAKLTGKSMDEVINWFIIALMLVFDPLAVSLVVGANVIFRDKNKEKEKLKLSEEIDKKIIEFEDRKTEIKNLEDEINNKSIEIENREKESIAKISEIESQTNLRLNQREELLNQQEDDSILRISEKEFESLEKIKLMEDSLDERKREVEELESASRVKVEQIAKDFKLKEETFQSYVKDEKSKIEKMIDDIKNRESELKINTKNYKDIVLKEEEEYKKKLQLEREKLDNDLESFKNEKKQFSSLKKKIIEDKEDLELLTAKLESQKEDLDRKENELENIKEELVRLDEEIKIWESQNMKMRRMTRPPSAL
jgi:hypothetical protein